MRLGQRVDHRSDVQPGKTTQNFPANTMFLSSSLTSIMLIATFSGFIGAFTAASFNFNDEYKI